jgi:hypothetical protein
LLVSPKKLYSFKIDPEVADALKCIKDRQGIGESEQIRRGIALWLKAQGVTVNVKTERKRATTRKHSNRYRR